MPITSSVCPFYPLLEQGFIQICIYCFFDSKAWRSLYASHLDAKAAANSSMDTMLKAYPTLFKATIRVYEENSLLTY